MAVKVINEENLKQKNCTSVVSLDIRGAFDVAWWPSILRNLTLILLNPSILAPPRNASTPNADKTRNSFGNAERVLSFYLTAQCRNTEHGSKQSWLQALFWLPDGP